MLDVVAAVIRRSDRYLIGLRPSHKMHGDMWEFPGGKLLANESIGEAASRELREELDVAVTLVGEVISSIPDPSGDVVIHFTEIEIDGEPFAQEHQRLTWATRRELADIHLAPADARFVSGVLNGRV